MRTLKALAIVTATACALALFVIALLELGCNTQYVKDRLGQIVMDGRQRTLKIEGDLSWSFSLEPALALRLGHVSLSEHGSTQPFAALDSAQATLRLWPLLSGQIDMEKIQIAGLKAQLVRRKDGTLNIADLLVSNKPERELPRFAIGSVLITDGELGWRDEISGQTLTFGTLQLSSGRLSNAARDVLALSAKLQAAATTADPINIDLKSHYDYDLQQKRYAIGQFEAQLGTPHLGNLREVAVQLDLTDLADLAALTGDATSLKFGKLTMQFAAMAGAAGTTRLSGKVASPLTIDLPTQTLELNDLVGELAVATPQMSLPPLTIAGLLRFDLARHAAAGKLHGQFDDSRIAASFDVVRYAPLSLDFDVTINRLDLDRYLPTTRDGKGNGTFDLAAFDALDLRGTMNIGELHVSHAKMRNVHLAINKAADDRLELAMPAAARDHAK